MPEHICIFQTVTEIPFIKYLFLVTFLVLRLDNAPEPYDVSFGNASYYNSTVNDSSMPAGQENARDGIPMDDIPALRTSV